MPFIALLCSFNNLTVTCFLIAPNIQFLLLCKSLQNCIFTNVYIGIVWRRTLTRLNIPSQLTLADVPRFWEDNLGLGKPTLLTGEAKEAVRGCVQEMLKCSVQFEWNRIVQFVLKDLD